MFSRVGTFATRNLVAFFTSMVRVPRKASVIGRKPNVQQPSTKPKFVLKAGKRVNTTFTKH